MFHLFQRSHIGPHGDAYHDAMIWSVFLLAPPLEVLLTTPGTLALHKPAWPRDAATRIDTESSLIGQVRRDSRIPTPSCRTVPDAIAGGIVVVATDRASLRAHNAAIAARLWGPKVYVAGCRRPSDSRIASALRGASGARAGTDDQSPPRSSARIARISRRPGAARCACEAAASLHSWGVLLAAPCPVDRSVLDLVISIRTGRFHQIRAMMAHAGAPLLHDPLYDEAARPSPSAPPFLTHALLGLPVPSEGRRARRARRATRAACLRTSGRDSVRVARPFGGGHRAGREHRDAGCRALALVRPRDRRVGVCVGRPTGTAAPGQAPVYAPLSPARTIARRVRLNAASISASVSRRPGAVSAGSRLRGGSASSSSSTSSVWASSNQARR